MYDFNVSIKNTSNIPAYIRAAVIITWRDANGNIYGQRPVAETDYTISFNTENWTLHDGFYYYDSEVAAGTDTAILIHSCTVVESKAPTGYFLSVEILAEAIQADGMGATSAQDAFAIAGGGA